MLIWTLLDLFKVQLGLAFLRSIFGQVWSLSRCCLGSEAKLKMGLGAAVLARTGWDGSTIMVALYTL